jgi:hypothetical protein
MPKADKRAGENTEITEKYKMKKRVAKKIEKNKEKLGYKPSQVAAAETTLTKAVPDAKEKQKAAPPEESPEK